MILARAPLRVSFFGGGSDIASHYQTWGGDFLSMAIDKYVYVAVNKTPHKHIKVSYSQQELVTSVDDIKNDIVKNTLKLFDIDSGIDISIFADIPTVGTGLAGSSALTCALIAALVKFKNHTTYRPYAIAELACYVEIDMCGWKIGKQDQYASAFGGMNHCSINKTGEVRVHKMMDNSIHRHMILVPTNISRHSSEILENIDFEKKSKIICGLADIARKAYWGIPGWSNYGSLLNRSWDLKRQMDDGVSNPEIDELIARMKNAGASGCKLLGAGGGGYMLAIANDVSDIEDEFPDRVCLRVNIAEDGAKVIYHD
jgi:D-glycero-alpha-D-manno-heptose-7-phosphate kinase